MTEPLCGVTSTNAVVALSVRGRDLHKRSLGEYRRPNLAKRVVVQPTACMHTERTCMPACMKQITQHEPPDLREPHVAASAFESAHQGRHHADSSPTCKPTGAVQWSGGGNYATAHIPVLACRLVLSSKRECPRSSDRVSCRSGSRQKNWLDDNRPVDVRLYARCDVRVVLWPFCCATRAGFLQVLLHGGAGLRARMLHRQSCTARCQAVLRRTALQHGGDFSVIGLTEFLVRFVEWGIFEAR